MELKDIKQYLAIKQVLQQVWYYVGLKFNTGNTDLELT